MTFDAGYWEDRYRTNPAATHREPNPHLVEAVTGLRPGSALEAGCGEGANAVWLATLGWHVTAADLAPSALDRARRYAQEQGPQVAGRIRWLETDLAHGPSDGLVHGSDDGPGARFDLVTSHYVHPEGSFEALVTRLAALVAPGGRLLLVGHGAHDAHSRAHAPGHASWRPAAIARLLDAADWEILDAGDHRVMLASGRELDNAVLLAVRTSTVEA